MDTSVNTIAQHYFDGGVISVEDRYLIPAYKGKKKKVKTKKKKKRVGGGAISQTIESGRENYEFINRTERVARGD